MNEFSENNNEINAQAQATKPAKTFDLKKEVFEWFYTILIAFLIAFIIKTFLFDIVKVDGNSMYPTLHHNDRLIITKLGYKPEQKDIIILDSNYRLRQDHYDVREQNGENFNVVTKFFDSFSLPQDLKPRYYVKRIIALPGQTVNIVDGKVFVDDKLLEEEYYDGITPAGEMTYPVTVDEGHVFVMGDNRTNSTDSRAKSLDQVPFEAILGKAQIRIWPFSSIGFTK